MGHVCADGGAEIESIGPLRCAGAKGRLLCEALALQPSLEVLLKRRKSSPPYGIRDCDGSDENNNRSEQNKHTTFGQKLLDSVHYRPAGDPS